jgi:hypothetical protein
MKGNQVQNKGGKNMALSVDSKIKDIMKNSEAVALMEKMAPGFSTNPQMKMVQGLTYRALAKFPQSGMSPEKVEEINQALMALDK